MGPVNRVLSSFFAGFLGSYLSQKYYFKPPCSITSQTFGLFDQF